eukprot:1160702-Pelagomonas_calceolata.AAC.3
MGCGKKSISTHHSPRSPSMWVSIHAYQLTNSCLPALQLMPISPPTTAAGFPLLKPLGRKHPLAFISCMHEHCARFRLPCTRLAQLHRARQRLHCSSAANMGMAAMLDVLWPLDAFQTKADQEPWRSTEALTTALGPSAWVRWPKQPEPWPPDQRCCVQAPRPSL